MIRSSRPRPTSRGFITLTALMLVMMMSMVVVSLTSLFRAEAMRTKRLAAEAQARQLLTAGAAAAHAMVNDASADAPDGGRTVPLPDGLADRKAAVRVMIDPAGDDGRRTARVMVELSGRRWSQALRYERGGDGWALAGVERAR